MSDQRMEDEMSYTIDKKVLDDSIDHVVEGTRSALAD